MNKYKEALDYIVKNSCPMKTCCSECKINKSCNSLAKDRINILQELVDKETPKKVIKLDKQEYGYTHKCPNCSQLVVTILYNVESRLINGIEEDDYCCSCGQILDWSEEDE